MCVSISVETMQKTQNPGTISFGRPRPIVKNGADPKKTPEQKFEFVFCDGKYQYIHSWIRWNFMLFLKSTNMAPWYGVEWISFPRESRN